MKVNIKAITQGLQHNSVLLLTINDVIPLGQYRGTTINSLIKTSAKYLKWLISEDIIKLDKQAMKILIKLIITIRNISEKKITQRIILV